MRKVKFILSASLLLLLFGVFPLSVQAFSLQDISDTMRGLFSTENNEKSLFIDFSTTILENGDLNKNGQIDPEDTVRFSFTITNPTQNTYLFTTLKTNLNSENISSIRNLQGALNLSEKDNTIILPNLTIKPFQVRSISFESQIIYKKDSEVSVIIQPELLDNKNVSLFKAEAKEIFSKKQESITPTITSTPDPTITTPVDTNTENITETLETIE